ncbi:MAG: hypothetical protein Q8L68_03090 [Methylococcales bacterium]|nr:hypothetical protein [Methylococcales bacterium]
MVSSGLTMQGLVAMGIGILALLVIFTIIPLVGSQLDQAVTIPGYTNETTKTGGSQWNATVNPSIPTAAGTWASLGGIIKVAAIIVIIGGFLQTLRGLRQDN